MNRKTFIALLPMALFSAKGLLAQSLERKKMLVAYYSWSGNTRRLANMIKDASGADLLEILPEKPYPDVYRQTVNIAKKEVDSAYKPPIKTKISNLSDYDLIFVGSPNWWGTISSPIRTFLSENDFSGKKLAPFITHEGSRLGRAVEDIKQLCPKSEILPALPIRGGSVNRAGEEVKTWLQKLGIQPSL